MKIIIALIMLSIPLAAFIPWPRPENPMPYPEGYRKWAHIKTAIVGPQSPGFRSTGGFHHIYANEKAMQGYETGNFPEGSVIVFDVLEALVRDNSNTEEGSRKHIDVMAKDSSKYRATGGWGYEEFEGDSKTVRNATTAVQVHCFNCHAKEKDYIFSTWRK